jgi:hypothetical protein
MCAQKGGWSGSREHRGAVRVHVRVSVCVRALLCARFFVLGPFLPLGRARLPGGRPTKAKPRPPACARSGAVRSSDLAQRSARKPNTSHAAAHAHPHGMNHRSTIVAACRRGAAGIKED